MFTIYEWRQRYEVSLKGREPKGDEELRVGPLAYVRLKVYGHRQGAGYRRLQQACGKRFLEVFGIFCKFLEISGNEPREKRGSLYNEKDEAATIEDIAFILGATEEQVRFAVDRLCQLGWVLDDGEQERKEPKERTTKGNTIKHKAPEISGKTRKSPAKLLKTQYLDCVFLTKQQNINLETKFGVIGAKKRIEQLNDGIMSKDYKYKSHYHSILNWARRENDDGKPPQQYNPPPANVGKDGKTAGERVLEKIEKQRKEMQDEQKARSTT